MMGINQAAIVNDNQQTIVQEMKEEDKQNEETTVPRQIAWSVWGLVVLIGLGIVRLVVYKIRRK
ncbi:hypothetical protein ACIXCD_04330 [Bacteroides fragilis]|nr:hypothetical protein E7X03_05365 [Bacteroides fragilis]THC76708.1 hypothetical protein E7X19_02180 [Bacteroides fragilis]THC84889.1 hypothetical protein E7X23_11810 [Bacteroides fragilis]